MGLELIATERHCFVFCMLFSPGNQHFEPHSIHVLRVLNDLRPALYSFAQGFHIAWTVPGRSLKGSVLYTQLWGVLNNILQLLCSWVPLVFGQLLALDKTGQRKKISNNFRFLVN